MRQKKSVQVSSRLNQNLKLAALIRNARLDAQLSEETVAQYVGVSISTLKAYETATKSIPLSHVYALSNCLNISPDVIVQLLR